MLAEKLPTYTVAETASEKAQPRTESIVDTHQLCNRLREVGLDPFETDNIELFSTETREKTIFISKDSLKVAQRFMLPQLAPQKQDSLDWNFKSVMQEMIASAAPFMYQLSTDTQNQLNDSVLRGLPSGYKAIAQGIVPQEDYSPGVFHFKDLTGIGKRSLTYPHIHINIYDAENNFVESVVLRYLTPEENTRLNRLKEVFGRGKSVEWKQDIQDRTQRFYNHLAQEGLADRLIEDKNSIGYMATRKGINMLDCLEIIMSEGGYKKWIETVDPESPALNLAPEQRQTLKNKKELAAEKQNPYEHVFPSPQEVLEEAINLAINSMELEKNTDPKVVAMNEKIVNRLRQYLLDLSNGDNHYYHNMVRLDQWDFSRFIKKDFLDTLGKIVDTGAILPRTSGTFTMGLYNAVFNPGFENADMLPNLFTEGKGAPVEVCIAQSVRPMMPAFKHAGCAVFDVPVAVKHFQRIIVMEKDVERTRAYLAEKGQVDMEVDSYESWLAEMLFIREAQINKMHVPK